MILNGLFEKEFKAINIGLVSFKEALDDAEYKCIQVDWSPPAGGDADVLAALNALSGL